MRIDVGFYLTEGTLGVSSSAAVAACLAPVKIPDAGRSEKVVSLRASFLESDGAVREWLSEISRCEPMTGAVLVSDRGPSAEGPTFFPPYVSEEHLSRVCLSHVWIGDAPPGGDPGRSVHRDLASVRGAIEIEVDRLVLKLPLQKSAGAGRGSHPQFFVRPVQTKDELRECFSLRFQVYRRLGYLKRLARSRLDLDRYDRTAIQFAAFHAADPSHVVATARLIAPGAETILHQRPGGFRAFDQQLLGPDYDRWVEDLAYEDEHTYHNALPGSFALPIFASFNYFRTEFGGHRFGRALAGGRDFAPRGRDLAPHKCCEVSRVVVHPKYRGRGLSRLMMDSVASAVEELGRPHLLLECSPHHERMYEAYGFRPIHEDSKKYYAREQQLDQIALAMARSFGAIDSRSGTLEFGISDNHSDCRVVVESPSASRDELDLLMAQSIHDEPPLAYQRSAGASVQAVLMASLNAADVEGARSVVRVLVRRDSTVRVLLRNKVGQVLLSDLLDVGPSSEVSSLIRRWASGKAVK